MNVNRNMTTRRFFSFANMARLAMKYMPHDRQVHPGPVYFSKNGNDSINNGRHDSKTYSRRGRSRFAVHNSIPQHNVGANRILNITNK